MFRTNSNFDKLLDKATSNMQLDPDWPSILQICDLIRQNDCNPKYAVTAIKKKIVSQNPHQAMFALLVLESVVKNCGSGVHDEVTLVTNCESYRTLVKTTEHDNVRKKMLELLQTWAFAFRKISKYRAIQDAVNILKAEGFKFPQLKESDAMFSADCAPEWADGDVCNRCRVQFSIVLRKHHCRACGQVFCQQCSAKTATLPKFGIEKEVRVCDACLEQITKPVSSNVTNKSESLESSTVHVSSSQESQPTNRKTAEELQEEEEIQLALALSQSEAEQKEKERQRVPPSHVAPVSNQQHQAHGSPPSSAPPAELSRYLDRNYWEQRVQPSNLQLDPPSAPTPSPGPAPNTVITDTLSNKISALKLENGAATDPEMEEFISTLKSQVEIFVNRMKSNSSRGRSIANDSSVQTLFMNITTMHSRLLRYIQQQDDSRVHYEKLQDKLAQVKDSRAALDVLREEHAERLRRAAEQAELQRQLQMAHKLDVMRKKKQEYLQYQRQLALQRVQEQEREMQMRQEQQKHQYMLGGTGPFFMQSSPVHQFHSAQQPSAFNQGYSTMLPPGLHQGPQMMNEPHNMIRQETPQRLAGGQHPQQNVAIQQGSHPSHIQSMNMQMPPMSQPQQIGQGGQVNPLPQISQIPPGMGPQGPLPRPGLNMNQLPHMNLPNQHGNQNLSQGPQLTHQSQMNKQPQVNIQNPQGIPQSSQISMQGSQALQHMGPSPQIPQALGQIQQISQHGQGVPPHQLPQMGQQPTPASQPGAPINQSSQINQQSVIQQQHQLQNKEVSMMYMDPRIGQQMGQMPQIMQMNPQGSHVGQMPPQISNMPPNIPSQPMGLINNQMPQNQMVSSSVSQINQGQMVSNNHANVKPVIDQKSGNNQLGNLSPTTGASTSNMNNQGSPIPAPLNQTVSSPQQPAPAEENSTAELISFD